MMRRLGRILVPLCTATCAAVVALWILSLFRCVETGYAWQHKSRTPYHGSGYVALALSDGVILVGGGVVPVAHPSGWSSRVGPVIPYGGSESMLSQMGFGARGIGRWGDEFFDREYVAPWWGVFVLTAWAPAVLVYRRRRREVSATSETKGSSSSPGDAA